jgi:hypothetical protein
MYIATDQDIETIAERFLTAQEGQSQASLSYLQFLVGTTQEELKTGLSAIDALAQVSARFYAVVLRKAITAEIADSPALPDGERKARARERNRKTNWARSNKSTLLAWLRQGNDIRTLDPAKVTKASLTVESAKPKAPSVKTLAKRASRFADEIEGIVSRMDDKKGAIPALHEILSRVSGLLSDIGIEPAKRVDVAIRERKPFTTRGHVFWPMDGMQ